VINQIRGFLLERGITFAKGPAKLRNQMAAILEDAEQNLTPRMRRLIEHLWQEWKQLDSDVERISSDISQAGAASQPRFLLARTIAGLKGWTSHSRSGCMSSPCSR
jgi:hypothetical protein